MGRTATHRNEGRGRQPPRDRRGTPRRFSLRLVAAVAAVTVASVAAVGYFLSSPGEASALAFDKHHVDLGTVARDQEGIQTFLAINRGDRPVEIGSVDIQVEQGCDEAEAMVEDIRIQPGKLILLPIKLGPHRELGPHRLLVNVASNDPSRPSSTLSLTFDVEEEPQASGGGPRLKVDKEIIDIGDVPYDWPLYEQFTLRNDGDQPLVLEGTPIVRVDKGC